MPSVWLLITLFPPHSLQLDWCSLSGKSSMCMMCLKYRIILLIVIKNPLVILLTYFLHRAPARTLLGRLQRPSDPSTFPYSALHLPFRHLAINLICRIALATYMRKVQRKHRKMWRNATLFMMLFVVKTKDKRKKRWQKGRG